MAVNGITYFNRTPIYPGDVDKRGVGLRSSEIDSNFFFLRGRDIQYGCWSGDTLLLKTVSGEDIEFSGKPQFVVSLSGSSFDADNGILTICANGESIELSGFTSCGCIDCSGITEEIEEILRRLDEHDRIITELNEDFVRTLEFLQAIKEDIDRELAELKRRLTADECNYRIFSGWTVTQIDQLKRGAIGTQSIADVRVNGYSVVDDDNVAWIDLTGYATIIQLNNLSQQVTNIDNRVTNIENRIKISGDDVEPIT